MPHSPNVAAVMVHVANVEQGLSWYESAFPTAVRAVAPGTDFEFFQFGVVQLEIVPADEKVGSGATGSVVYWRVGNLADSFRHLCSLGATLYRGPMQIDAGQGMCQVQDTWGQLHRSARPVPAKGGSFLRMRHNSSIERTSSGMLRMSNVMLYIQQMEFYE